MANGQKKGLSPLAWIAIGCGALVVLVVIVLVVGGLFVANKVKDVAGDFEANPELTAARMIVRLNPEWEEVDFDEDAGTITIREVGSGKEVTVDFEDIKDGNLVFTTEEGSMVISGEENEEGAVVSVTTDEGTLTYGATERGAENIPDWLPVYPGTEPSGGFYMQGDEGTSGAFEVKTEDAVDQVIEFYRSNLTDLGFEMRVNTFAGGDGTESAMVIGTDDSKQRSVQVAIGRDNDETSVTVSYSTGS